MGDAQLQLKKNSTPPWDLARKAPGLRTSSPAAVLQTGLRCDQQGRCGLLGPDHWLSLFWAARHLQPHLGHSCQERTQPFGVEGSVLPHAREEAGSAGQSQVLHPIHSPLQKYSGSWGTSIWGRGCKWDMDTMMQSLACRLYPGWCSP